MYIKKYTEKCSLLYITCKVKLISLCYRDITALQDKKLTEANLKEEAQ